MTGLQQCSGCSLNQQLHGGGQGGSRVQSLQDHQPEHYSRAINASSNFHPRLLLQVLQQTCGYDLLEERENALRMALHTQNIKASECFMQCVLRQSPSEGR